LPLLWAQGSGADVMKRIAAPMVGGLFTSAFLTLEIIPVVYTYFRYEQLLWERLGAADPERLRALERPANVLRAGWAALALAAAALALVSLPGPLPAVLLALPLLAIVSGTAVYLARRPAAKRLAFAS
jgi:hypothetical protein